MKHSLELQEDEEFLKNANLTFSRVIFHLILYTILVKLSARCSGQVLRKDGWVLRQSH